MKRKMVNKLVVYCICFMLAIPCTAQNSFEYKAKLEAVKQDGFYKILLHPNVIANSQGYLEDIRLFDEKSNAVPYIIKQDEKEFSEKLFVEFPIISNKKKADKQTHIIIENKTSKAINDLLLVTTNMDAKRVVNISGSNDTQEWFVVKEGIGMDTYFTRQEEEETVVSVSLPNINYKYLQLTIIGKDVLPFNVRKVGVYKDNYRFGKYLLAASPVITQKDSTNKFSYVQLTFNNAYKIDKLEIETVGPKFFKRNINLYIGNYFSTRTPYTNYISSNNTEFFLNGMKSKEFLLEINNEDNTPLKIVGAKAYQLNQYLLAYLEKGKQYHLAFGDSLATKPNYDLQFFKDSIAINIPEVSVGNIEPISKSTAYSTYQSSNKIFLWIAVAAVSILLLFFTFKMTKEINKRNSQ